MADCYVIVTARRCLSRNRFLVKRFACLTSHGEGQLSPSSQSEASAQESSHEATHQVAFTKRPWRASQLIRIGESTRSDGQNWRIHKIRWSELYRPIISFEQLFHRYIMATFFGEPTRSDGQNRRIHKIGWSESYRPIRSL